MEPRHPPLLFSLFLYFILTTGFIYFSSFIYGAKSRESNLYVSLPTGSHLGRRASYSDVETGRQAVIIVTLSRKPISTLYIYM